MSQTDRLSQCDPVCGPQIHLCCGNHSLGSTDVSLSALSAVSVDLESKAATVEGAFLLKPPRRTQQALPALPADLQPTVGVAVTLRREEVAPQVGLMDFWVTHVENACKPAHRQN